MCELLAALGTARARAPRLRARADEPALLLIGGSTAAPGRLPLGRDLERRVFGLCAARGAAADKGRAKNPR
jgi:hypothetical protein